MHAWPSPVAIHRRNKKPTATTTQNIATVYTEELLGKTPRSFSDEF